jgi:hypothetical protein
MATMAGINEQQEHAAYDEGSNKEGNCSKAMVMVMRVVDNKESKGGKAMAMATRVACDKEGNVDSGKCVGDKGGRQTTATWAMMSATLTTWAMAMVTRLVARVMVTATRVAGNEEGKGGKAMEMATRVKGKWTATATKRAMAMAMRMAGKQQEWQQRWQWRG